jgi:hypothetical protein
MGSLALLRGISNIVARLAMRPGSGGHPTTRPTDGKIKAARRGRSVGRKEGNDQRLGTMCAGARKPAGSRKSLQIQAGAHLALGP